MATSIDLSGQDERFRKTMQQANTALGPNEKKKRQRIGITDVIGLYANNAKRDIKKYLGSSESVLRKIGNPFPGRGGRGGTPPDPQVQSPIKGGPATTPAGTTEQAVQGDKGSAGALGNISGESFYGPPSPISSYRGGDTGGADSALNPYKSEFGYSRPSQPEDFTSFGELTIDRPDSPGQQGTRLGANFQGNQAAGGGTFNVIGRQEGGRTVDDNIVLKRLTDETNRLRAQNAGSQAQALGEAPTGNKAGEGPSQTDKLYERQEVQENLKKELGDIKRMLDNRVINGRTATAMMNEARGRVAGIFKDTAAQEETSRANREDFQAKMLGHRVDREKLAYDTAADARTAQADAYKNAYDIKDKERNYQLNVAKYGLDEANKMSLAQDREEQRLQGREKLGQGAAGTQISGYNAQTKAFEAADKVWGRVNSEGLDPDQARASTIQMIGSNLALQRDPEGRKRLSSLRVDNSPESRQEFVDWAQSKGYSIKGLGDLLPNQDNNLE